METWRLALAAVAIVLALGVGPVPAQEPVKVGVVLTLTTDMAFDGTPQLNAVKMATEKVNAGGGIRGRCS